MEKHMTAVALLATEVRKFHDKKEPFRIYHGSTNSTRPKPLDRMIDTSGLNKILLIDEETKTALVEPNVSMDALVTAALKKGLVPPVVMEFPGITVGGGFAGTSGESSSFRYGFFNKIVNSIQIILGDGKVVGASATVNPDLFHAATGSLGTLGVITLLELQLVEAKPYVALTYHPVKVVGGAIDVMKTLAKDDSIDYLDGIMFGLNSGVIISGKLVDKIDEGLKVQRFSRATDPWHYMHAEDMVKRSSGPKTEVVPLVDYLFRYDRGAFWMGKYAFSMFKTPFNRITRWALDYYMHPRVMYHALHESGLSAFYTIQDVALPVSTVEKFLEFHDDEFGYYPLWLCPLKAPTKDASFHPRSEELMISVGTWGASRLRPRGDHLKSNRKLEAKLTELSGMKWMYAHAYYTLDEFWSIYDRKWYDSLREKYNATLLPTVYDKVYVDLKAMESKITGIWTYLPLCGLYGVYKATFGGEYLIPMEGEFKFHMKLLAALLFALLPFLLPYITGPL